MLLVSVPRYESTDWSGSRTAMAFLDTSASALSRRHRAWFVPCHSSPGPSRLDIGDFFGASEQVGLVVDREVVAVADPGRLEAEDPAAGGSEGEDPDRAPLRADRRLDPLAHLCRRLIRECDREDLVRLDAAGGEQVRDAVC